MTPPPDADREPDADVLAELAARLLFPFLRTAARLAARFRLPLDRVTELTQLAYFQELRRRRPRDLSGVAADLGVSLRTAGTLSQKLKGDFLKPELDVRPLRELTALLLDGPQRRSRLLAAADDDERGRRERALDVLLGNGWVSARDDGDDPLLSLTGTLRSFVSDDLDRRLDGLSHQLEIVEQSAAQRFVLRNDDTARGRTWFFAARPDAVAALIEETVRELRHRVIDLEETALREGDYQRFGVTLAITPVEEDDR